MTSPFALNDRRVLITGASSGLGRAAALMVADAGGQVIATGRDSTRLAATVDALASPVKGPASGPTNSPANSPTKSPSNGRSNGRASGPASDPAVPGHDTHRMIVADLCDASAVDTMVSSLDPIDGLVLAAGVARVAPLRYTDARVLRRILAINLESRLQLCQALIAQRRLRDGAAIVLVSSLSVAEGVKGHTAYAASMAANEGASRAMAAELVGRRIRCNVVAPGLVKTPVLDDGAITRSQLAAMIARYPLGLGDAEDVAAAIVYLLAPASRWVTGQVLRLDGGYTLDA